MDAVPGVLAGHEFSLAGALKVKLSAGDREELRAGGTSNPAALDAYLQGRSIGNSGDEASVRAEIAAYDRALTLDPGYAFAYAARGDELAFLMQNWIGDPQEKDRLGKEALAMGLKAIALAPQSGQVYAAYANILAQVSLNISEVDAALKRGLEVEPGNANLLRAYARWGAGIGKPDALAAANQAAVLDPLSGETIGTRALVLRMLRRYDEAARVFRQMATSPENKYRVIGGGFAELAAGRADAALPFCEPAPEHPVAQECLAIAYRKLGRRDQADAVLQRMKRDQGDAYAYQYAVIYAQWDEPELALNWLEKAFQLRDPGLSDANAEPLLDPIRSTPRFAAVLRKLHFPG